MLERDRWRLVRREPIDRHRHPPADLAMPARSGSDRAASLCPQAIDRAHNPKRSTTAHPGTTSAMHLSSLVRVIARMPDGSAAESTHCGRATGLDRYPALSEPHCNRQPSTTGTPAFRSSAAVGDQPFEPRQLVIELRSGLWIAVGKVNGSDQDAVDGRLDITRLPIGRIAGQARFASPRDPAPVPGLPLRSRNALPATPRDIRGCSRVRAGKGSLLCLQFLQAHDVRRFPTQPADKIVQPLIDVVDVEGGDLHSLAGIANSRMECGCSSMSAHMSPVAAILALIFRSVNVRGSMLPLRISSQVHGADTGAPAFAGPHTPPQTSRCSHYGLCQPECGRRDRLC